MVPLIDGDDYRNMAGKLRELALYTRSVGIHLELVDLAGPYAGRGDHFDSRLIGKQQHTGIRPR